MCYFYMGLCTCSDMFDTCFRKRVALLALVSENRCFYLGFVHSIDNMRNATLVFTRFAMVFHIFRKQSVFGNFVRMIYKLRNFALLFASVVSCLTNVSEHMQFSLGFVHVIDNMCNVT